MRITRTLTTAIAIAALAAPAAQARPADVPAVQQDMRASVATAAAQQAKQRPLGHAGDADWNAVPQPSADTRPISPAPVSAPADDGGVGWTTLGLGIFGVLLAAGGIAAVYTRRSHPRLRVNV